MIFAVPTEFATVNYPAIRSDCWADTKRKIRAIFYYLFLKIWYLFKIDTDLKATQHMFCLKNDILEDFEYLFKFSTDSVVLPFAGRKNNSGRLNIANHFFLGLYLSKPSSNPNPPNGSVVSLQSVSKSIKDSLFFVYSKLSPEKHADNAENLNIHWLISGSF